MKNRLSGKFVIVVLHPAVDRTVQVSRLQVGGVIRGRPVMVEAAGKGINIAHTLANLGHPLLATGFLGRGEAEFFLSSFRGAASGAAGRVALDFVPVECATRENLTIIERDAGRDTHILVGSMRVGPRETERLLRRMRRRVAAGDWAVFGGSCPSGLKRADYVEALRTCKARGASVCVDASGSLLRAALSVRPWVVKPNREELEELAGRRLRSRAAVLRAARALLERCEHVVVSLGAEGAVLVTRDGAWHARETRCAKVVHTVGCGDALFAGFLAAYARGRRPAEALRFAVACGSACVRTHYASLRSRDEPLRFLRAVRVSPA